MKQIPNLFTLLNLLLGCLATVFTLQNGIAISYGSDGAQLIDMTEKMWLASLCIGLAALVDFLDGFVARLFKSVSDMGKQLDSLADLVSFGVAPGMILYQFLRLSFIRQPDGIDVSIGWLLPALLLPCAAAYRLARFNLDNSQQFGFKGVPVPAVGLLVASFPLIYWDSNAAVVAGWLLNPWVLYALILVLSLLMVSRMPVLALKFKDVSLKNNLPKIILLAAAILALIVLKWLAVPVIFLFYIVLSLIFKKQTT
jgi:CDP-diacylglycerol---serine O-phosphatidyltransferase